MSEEKTNAVDLGSLGSFDFTPSWAKSETKVSVGKFRPDEGRGTGDEGRGPRSARRSFGEGGKDFGDRGPRKPFGEKPVRRSFGEGGKKFGDRKSFDRRPRFEERPRPLDCEVKILPETKALGTIIRKLQGDLHAYKLKDLAYFFLDNPQSVLLKITPKVPASQPQPSASTSFYQCKACGFASTKQEDVIEHVMTSHLADYYDAKEIDCEPPKGNFTCVAKCGLSGVLLGPPNIHEFNAVVREMIRTKYPDMSEEQYRAHIEMVRDSETIEQWRASAVKKTVFFQKGQAEVEGAAQLTREQAEGEFRRTILPSLLDTPKHLMITADVAMRSPVKPLVWAVNDALAAERRAPYGMCFALRGAFHHRKLNFFRANDPRGPEFVLNAELKEFDSAHAIPELAAAAKFLTEHPCCDKSEFPADVADFEQHLMWLVSTGHAVAFTNGVYSIAEKFPKYGPQWKKRSAAPSSEAKAEGQGERSGSTAELSSSAAVQQNEKAEMPSLTLTSDLDLPQEVDAAAESNNQTSEQSNNETTPVVAE